MTNKEAIKSRPQGDLISREALKKRLDELHWTKEHGFSFRFVIDDIIDNAPTVKTFTLADIEEQYRKGLEKGLSEWETERPQGEWKLHGMIYYCSVCGHDYEQGGNNFCGNCGADMRGEEE